MSADNPQPYREISPAPSVAALPVLVTSPHSGAFYPADFLAAAHLDDHAIRQSEDMFVGDLFTEAAGKGVRVLEAVYPRAYVDLNRGAYELEPALFDGQLPAHVDSKSPRAGSGLGTVPRLVAENKPIYNRKLQYAEAETRIETIYRPFHRRLAELLDDMHQAYGMAVLLDAHSMPSQAARASHHLPASGAPEIDFVLGNRHGRSCHAGLTNWLRDFLTSQGYRVALNKPYAGGFITEHYGRPAKGIHALQIEINRAIYMDEKTYRKHEGFERLRALFSLMLTEIASNLPALPTPSQSPDNGRSAAE